MNTESMSYVGQKIYVGIDVHKDTYSVTCVCNKLVVKRATVETDPTGFSRSLQTWFKGATIYTVYEAGFSAFVLHRALTNAGITNIVVNPASVAVAANDKVKTDKKDSKKLAVDLADGRLMGIYVPSDEEELARLIPRTRAQIVEHRATIARQIKAKLHQFGLIPPLCKRLISSRYLRIIESWDLADELKISIKLLADHWRFLNGQLIEMRRLLREQAKAQAPLETVYRSVPGVGPVVARTLATELGNMSRFQNERALFSYTGLTPCEYSSGSSVRRGHISRQGSSRVRHLLIETAWRAIAKDEVLKETFERIAKTRGKKRAIIAIARRLIGRIRACFRLKTTYAIGTYA
jgi:transposase